MILYVATTNPGKLRDFSIAAAAAAISGDLAILPLPGLKDIPAPDEDALTFEGNAILKACFYSLQAPGEIVLADDSGLEVDALGGAPGVRSARYGEDVADPSVDPELPIDTRNNLTLINALSRSPEGRRIGRYRCVVAAARNGQVINTGAGTIEGEIGLTPRGRSGFGYDPYFYLPDLGLTMAELDPETRLRISHRGRALATLLPRLQPA
jgi:XTP/dITP diphosphohydrolase